jgi:hypothetical protein
MIDASLHIMINTPTPGPALEHHYAGTSDALGRSFASPQRLSELFQFGMTGGSGLFPAWERIYRRLCPPAVHPKIPTVSTRMDGAAPGLHLVRDW